MRSGFIITNALLLLVLNGCKNKATTPEGGSQPVSVVCTECKATSTLNLKKYAADETWPKECAQCRKLAVYPYIKCSRCGQPVPLKDARTGGYGYPRICPHCQRKWEP